MKLIAISCQGEKELEDLEDCRRRSLTGVLEVLEQCRRQKGGYEAVELQDGRRIPEKEVFIGQRGQGQI